MRRVPPGVETVAGQGPFDDAQTRSWRDYKRLLAGKPPSDKRRVGDADTPVDAAFLEEEHHRQYGRPWLLGRYAFDFLLERGLQPGDRLLDLGCGALRIGVHAIRYLDEGCYCGIDPHLKSLEAAATYELPLHGLEAKRPRLLWNDRYEVGHFGETFDWALDFSTSLHLQPEDLPVLLGNTASVLRPGGLLLVCPRLRLDEGELAGLGLRLADSVVQPCPLLEGHEFASTNQWFVLERV